MAIIVGQKIIDGKARITLLPERSDLLGQLLAAGAAKEHTVVPQPSVGQRGD